LQRRAFYKAFYVNATLKAGLLEPKNFGAVSKTIGPICIFFYR